jgi:hypothetical protein
MELEWMGREWIEKGFDGKDVHGKGVNGWVAEKGKLGWEGCNEAV